MKEVTYLPNYYIVTGTDYPAVDLCYWVARYGVLGFGRYVYWLRIMEDLRTYLALRSKIVSSPSWERYRL